MSIKRFARLVGVAAVAVVLGIGCGDDNPVDNNGGTGGSGGDGKGGGGNGGVIDQRLVSGTGEAWIEWDDYYGDDDGRGNWGCVYQANGVFKSIDRYSSDWEVNKKGTWSTKDDELIVKVKYPEDNYTISGNTLTFTFGEVLVATKTFGITPVMVDEFQPQTSSGTKDSRLVNGPNDAWVECRYDSDNSSDHEYEYCFGVIFKQDGSVIELYKDDDGIWYGGYERVSWHTQGNNKLIWETLYKYKYSISDDYLNLVDAEDDEYTMTFRKRTGLTITNNPNLSKSLEIPKEGSVGERSFLPKEGFVGSRRR